MELKLSASQIKSFQQSARYWALEKLEGCPRAGSPYMKIGSEIHKGLEGEWPSDKEMPEYVSKCVVEWDKVKDELVKDPKVEQYIESVYVIPDRKESIKVILRGYIDVLDDQDDKTVIIDHKSSASGSTFYKEGSELRDDIQMKIYALWALQELDPDEVQVIHAQYKYRNKKKILKIIDAVFDTYEVGEMRADILNLIQPIVDVAVGYDGDWRSLDHGESRWPHEFDMIDSGAVTVERYKEVFATLPEPVYREDIVEALKKDVEELTKKNIDAILKLANQEKGSMIVNLTDVVKVARDNNSEIKSKWDNIDAVVDASVKYLLEKDGLDLVMIPSHFNIDADYDYKKIITLLKENNIKVGKWV